MSRVKPFCIGGRQRIISVVAGGWSIAEMAGRAPDWHQRLPGFRIGVNESGVLIPGCEAIVSMDRLWTEARWKQLRERGELTWLRRNAVLNLGHPRFPWLTVFDCDHLTGEFAETRSRLNGPNSAHCALNLAWQLEPEHVFLFGFDMQRGPRGQSHWHPPYRWRPDGATSSGRFSEWVAALEQAAKAFEEIGAKVINASTRTRVSLWPRVDPMEVLRDENDRTT